MKVVWLEYTTALQRDVGDEKEVQCGETSLIVGRVNCKEQGRERHHWKETGQVEHGRVQRKLKVTNPTELMKRKNIPEQ